MKPETIRNLKRELEQERSLRWKWEGEAKNNYKLYVEAERERDEWKARFDVLLRHAVGAQSCAERLLRNFLAMRPKP